MTDGSFAAFKKCDMKNNILKDKSYRFALRVVKLCKYLNAANESILSKQILRSGTAIGALAREAEFAESKADFIHKLYIALKEANETEYWLSLLYDSGYLNDKMYQSLKPEIDELIKLLVSSIKTTKSNSRRRSNESQ